MSYAIMEGGENQILAWDYLKRSLSRGGAFRSRADDGGVPYARYFEENSGVSAWQGVERRLAAETHHGGRLEDSSGIEASVSDTGGSIVIRAELPGVELEDIHVELMDNILMLRIEKEPEPAPEGSGPDDGHADAKAIKKSFVLPDSVYLFPEMIRATLVDGVFRLEILKHG